MAVLKLDGKYLHRRFEFTLTYRWSTYIKYILECAVETLLIKRVMRVPSGNAHPAAKSFNNLLMVHFWA